jgi:hypothetical protein
MENHVGLIFNISGCTLKACAFMAGGLDGLRQVAFPFNAKVMATSAKSAKASAKFAVKNRNQVWCRLVKRKVAANVL